MRRNAENRTNHAQRLGLRWPSTAFKSYDAHFANSHELNPVRKLIQRRGAEMQRNAEMKERIFNRRQPRQQRLCRTGIENIFVCSACSRRVGVTFCSSSFCCSAPFVPLCGKNPCSSAYSGVARRKRAEPSRGFAATRLYAVTLRGRARGRGGWSQ